MKRLIRFAGRLLLPAIEEAKLELLRAKLAHCGVGVKLRMPLVIESPEHVTIADGVSVGSFVHMWGNAGIAIGARTMIGAHAAITSAGHDRDAAVMSVSLTTARVRIEEDVWIGTHAVIFPGVTIGAHAIVGAGAIVRHDVAPYAVVAGVPAEVIGNRQPGGAVSQRPGA